MRVIDVVEVIDIANGFGNQAFRCAIPHSPRDKKQQKTEAALRGFAARAMHGYQGAPSAPWSTRHQALSAARVRASRSASISNQLPTPRRLAIVKPAPAGGPDPRPAPRRGS